ncbi:hypothetical protein CVT24_012526 [Panaeolus cyanescens]|uniref:Hemerythrin-like domain-containing protein n=1 Tax=Panaeolus cyanescens TaxID=181874 RepID=A0A409YK06_9AGAR|nr:hypothetical protein CVT24_012526 [Panaeolus cyanescens]
MASESTTGPYSLIPLPEGVMTQTVDKDPKNMMVIDMVLVHNVFIRAMNSIHINAPKVIPRDVPAFIGYCLTVLQTIEFHHHLEEETIFPVLEKKIGEISQNVVIEYG